MISYFGNPYVTVENAFSGSNLPAQLASHFDYHMEGIRTFRYYVDVSFFAAADFSHSFQVPTTAQISL